MKKIVFLLLIGSMANAQIGEVVKDSSYYQGGKIFTKYVITVGSSSREYVQRGGEVNGNVEFYPHDPVVFRGLKGRFVFSQDRLVGVDQGVSTGVLAEPFTFYPTTIGAGDGQILTIIGKGFGEATKVSFQTTTNFWADALETDFVSKTFTELKLRMPYRSSTGKFKVILSDGVEIMSDQSLTVIYSIYNYISNQEGASKYYRVGHVSERLDVLFANSLSGGERSNVRTMMEDLRCRIGIDWKEGSTTNETSNGDGESVARHGTSPGCASTAYHLKTCFENGQLNVRWEDNDVTFDECNSLSVTYHEFCHWIGLGHVRQSSSVVYPTTSGAKSPSPDDIAGLLSIMDYSTTHDPCGFTRLENASCYLGIKDHEFKGRLVKTKYFDMLGREINIQFASSGIYFRYLIFENGFDVVRVFINNK